jgi:hypothetical protein
VPSRASARPGGGDATGRKQAHAFVTARKGFCYLTVRLFGRHHHMMRIRAYRIEPDEKRQMRRLYPEVAFDWKKITEQLAEKREACRRYRTRPRRRAGRGGAREDGPLLGIFEPATRTVLTNGVPSTASGRARVRTSSAPKPPVMPARRGGGNKAHM